MRRQRDANVSSNQGFRGANGPLAAAQNSPELQDIYIKASTAAALASSKFLGPKKNAVAVETMWKEVGRLAAERGMDPDDVRAALGILTLNADAAPMPW